MPRRFGTANIISAVIGISSLPGLAISLRLLMDGILLSVGRTLFIASAGLSIVGVILNFRALGKIGEGLGGEYDLAFTWAGVFAASFGSIFLGFAFLVIVL